MSLRTSSTHRNAFSCIVRQQPGCKGGLCCCPPISSIPPQPLRGCFPTEHRQPLTTISPAPGPNGRGGEGAAAGLSPGQRAAGPQHLGLPAHHGRLLPRAAQPSPAARHARLHPPLLQVLPLRALRWGPEGAVSCFGGVWFFLVAWSAGLQRLCISGSSCPWGLPLLNWFLPLLHQSGTHLLRKQIPLFMLLGYGLLPRPPWGDFGIFWFKLD